MSKEEEKSKKEKKEKGKDKEKGKGKGKGKSPDRKNPSSRDVPLASSRRMLKEASSMRVGKDTAEKLSKFLEDLTEEIGLEAKGLVKLEGGKTIQEKHIEKAINTVF